MRVLVAEAAQYMADAFREAIDMQDHNVTCFKRICSINPLIGAHPLPSVAPLVGMTANNHQSLITQRFDVALIDGNATSPDSSAVLRALTARNVPCIAISFDKAHNQAMIGAGARLALSKPAALAALYNGKLRLEQVSTMSAQMLSDLYLFAHFHRDNAHMRSAMHDLVEAHRMAHAA